MKYSTLIQIFLDNGMDIEHEKNHTYFDLNRYSTRYFGKDSGPRFQSGPYAKYYTGERGCPEYVIKEYASEDEMVDDIIEEIRNHAYTSSPLHQKIREVLDSDKFRKSDAKDPTKMILAGAAIYLGVNALKKLLKK